MSDTEPSEKKGFKQQSILCDRGQKIIKQGTPAFEAYYMEEGRAEVVAEEDGEKIVLSEIGPGEIFGEMGIIDQEPRSASVVALEKCKLTVISKEDLLSRIDNVPDKFVQSLLTFLARRLRDSNVMQVERQKNMSSLQNRLVGIMEKVEHGIEPSERKAFSEEVSPILEKLEAVLDKYRKW